MRWRRWPTCAPGPRWTQAIVLTGCGLGGVVALFAAAIDGAVAGVITWDALVSFRALLEEETYTWPADAFIPNVLRHFDLPELIASLSCPVRSLNPLDGCRERLSGTAGSFNSRGYADERERCPGLGGEAATGGGDIGFASVAHEADGEIAQGRHHLRDAPQRT